MSTSYRRRGTVLLRLTPALRRALRKIVNEIAAGNPAGGRVTTNRAVREAIMFAAARLGRAKGQKNEYAHKGDRKQQTGCAGPGR